MLTEVVNQVKVGSFSHPFKTIRLLFSTRGVATYWLAEIVQVEGLSTSASLFSDGGVLLGSGNKPTQ